MLNDSRNCQSKKVKHRNSNEVSMLTKIEYTNAVVREVIIPWDPLSGLPPLKFFDHVL